MYTQTNPILTVLAQNCPKSGLPKPNNDSVPNLPQFIKLVRSFAGQTPLFSQRVISLTGAH